MSSAEPSPTQARLKESLLEPLKAIFIRTAVEKDVAKRMQYYLPHAISMPEYQPTLEGADAISKYYETIFSRQNITRFERKIAEVILLEKTIVERNLRVRTRRRLRARIPSIQREVARPAAERRECGQRHSALATPARRHDFLG